MDFYLTSLPTIKERLSNDISSAHHMLLQVLDLAVMLFLDDEDKARIDSSNAKVHNEKDNSGQARRQIVSVLAAIHSLGRKTLDSLVLAELESKMVGEFLPSHPFVLDACC